MQEDADRQQSSKPEATIALVTGASSGIGRAIAQALVDAGYRVICTARRQQKLVALSEELGPNAYPLTLDVTDRESVESLLNRLPADWQPIGVLVNNAGHDAGGRKAFHAGDVEQWAQIIETNVIGVIRVTHAIIATMLARDSGHVVNIGSTSGIESYATGTIYAGSKHALHGFSESLRKDYTGTGVRVTEVLPGMVKTGFAQTRWNDASKAERFYSDFGQCLNPADVAGCVRFALQQPPHVVVSQLVVVPNTKS